MNTKTPPPNTPGEPSRPKITLAPKIHARPTVKATVKPPLKPDHAKKGDVDAASSTSSRDVIAMLVKRLGDAEKNIKALQKAQSTTQHELASLHSAIADELLRNGRPKAAVKHCRQALRSQPTATQRLRDLADALAQSKNYVEAIKAYTQLAKRTPQDLLVHELLAATYARSGDKDRCQRVLRGFLKHTPHTIWMRSHPDDPHILRLSGLDSTYCNLSKGANGRPRPVYRGGHFTTRSLLPSKGYNVTKWTIVDDNINTRSDVPKFDLMLNTIAEADAERRSLRALCTYVDAHPDINIINRPQRVLQTARDINCERLNKIDGVFLPRTERIVRQGKNADQLLTHLLSLDMNYPLIMRETGTHTAHTVKLAKTPQDSKAYFENSQAEEFYAIEFIDERINGRYYNKKRFFCIDGELFPVVSHVDEVWNVHGANRRVVMAHNPWMQEQERAYLEDPKSVIGEKNYETLKGLYDLVGLDFFGMDYMVREDGTLLIYELNASMRHSSDHSRNFAYMQPHIDRITDAFAAMLQRRIESAAKSD